MLCHIRLQKYNYHELIVVSDSLVVTYDSESKYEEDVTSGCCNKA